MALSAHQKELLVASACRIMTITTPPTTQNAFLSFINSTKAEQIAAVEADLLVQKAGLQARHDALPDQVAPAQAALQAEMAELDDIIAQI